MKRLISLVLALVMVLMVGAAFATGDGAGEGGETPAATTNGGSITIKRDATYVEGENNATTYTYYKIFDAVVTKLAEVNENTGANAGDGVVVYTVDSAEKAAAITATGLFNADLAADGKYYITLKSESTTAETIASEFKTMVTADGSPFTGTSKVSDGATTTISVADGYYLILANNGNKMIVQTLGENVVIKEKNTYPTITKEEMDPETAAATYGTTAPSVSVGDVINYQIKVNVPADANADIIVTDKMKPGLTFNDNLTIKIGETALVKDTDYTEGTAGTGETWKITIKANESTKGKEIVFAFTATVNADAITTVKENEVDLDYGNYHDEKTVPFKTYKTAAYKYNGADYTEELENVEFTLKENNVEFKVSLHADGYYYPDANGESTVKTNGDGLIIIRGLDIDKTYTITETKNPNPGFNLVKDPVELTLIEDDATDDTAYVPTVGATLAEKDEEVAAIANNQGTELPSTGGIGTTIFYVVGGLLLIGAAVVLVARRKASN